MESRGGQGEGARPGAGTHGTWPPGGVGARPAFLLDLFEPAAVEEEEEEEEEAFLCFLAAAARCCCSARLSITRCSASRLVLMLPASSSRCA